MPATRRRWRAGRPRKDGDRFKSGKLKHRAPGPTREHLQRRAELVGHQHARSDHASWEPGRLFLRGLIDDRQLEAAKRYQGRVQRYRALIEAPRVKTLILDPRGPAPDQIEAFQRVKRQYNDAFEALRNRGHGVLRATNDAVFHDMCSRPGLVREGLQALADRLGL
jgi:hypothetical protein